MTKLDIFALFIITLPFIIVLGISEYDIYKNLGIIHILVINLWIIAVMYIFYKYCPTTPPG